MRRGRLSDQLKLMRRGSELYVRAKDKDITSMATYYDIKGLTTERYTCRNARTKRVIELVMIKKH